MKGQGGFKFIIGDFLRNFCHEIPMNPSCFRFHWAVTISGKSFTRHKRQIIHKLCGERSEIRLTPCNEKKKTLMNCIYPADKSLFVFVCFLAPRERLRYEFRSLLVFVCACMRTRFIYVNVHEFLAEKKQNQESYFLCDLIGWEMKESGFLKHQKTQRESSCSPQTGCKRKVRGQVCRSWLAWGI